MAYFPPTGSVVAFQNDPSKLVGTVSITGTIPINNASILAVLTRSSVAALQGTNPWLIGNSSVQVVNPVSLLAVNPNPASVYVVNPVSTLAIQTGNSSVQVVGVMPPQSVSGVGIFSMNHIGNGSIITVGNYLEKNVATPSVFGFPFLFKTGVDNSILSTISTTDPLPIRGSVTTLQGTNPWNVNVPTPSYLSIQPGGSVLQVRTDNASVVAVLTTSSVAVLQGTNPWITLNTGSILATLKDSNASVITVAQGSVAAAITNISASISTLLNSSNASVLTKSFITRSDTLNSILGIDLTTRPLMGDALGRTIIKPFASEDSSIISYVGSVVSASVTLIQPSVTGKRSYITDFWVTNTGSVTQLITFQGGDTSILAFTIAPAGGGSNSPGIAIPLKTTISQDLAFKATGTSSVVYVTVKGYQGQ